MNARVVVCVGLLTTLVACGGHGASVTPTTPVSRNVRAASTAGGVWRMLNPTTIPERRGAAVAYHDATHSLVVFGGDNTWGVQQDTWTWDGARWTQHFPPIAPLPRTNAAFAYNPRMGVVVLFGGDPFNTSGYLGDTWTWDGTRWQQLQPPVSPPARTHASMAYDAATGTIVLFGGISSTGFLNDTWSFDGVTWHQIQTAAAPSERYDATLAYHNPSGKLVLFSGFTGASALGDTWTFDGSNWHQENPTVAPPARQGAILVAQSDTSLVLFGGYHDDGIGSGGIHQAVVPGGAMLSDTWTWNGSAWSPQLTSTAPQARYDSGAAYDAALGQPVIVSGCCNAFGGFLDDIWSFSNGTWSTHVETNAPSPRSGAAFVDNPSGGELLFGGFGGDGFLSDSWTFNGGSWTRNSQTTPPARFAASAAYDVTRNNVVLFGGQGTSPTSCADPSEAVTGNPNHLCDDTWLWNGSSWKQITSAVHPSHRSLAMIADDPLQISYVILFGGFADLQSLGDTWAWDGLKWIQMHPGTSPGARDNAVFTYDPDLHAPVLFGGDGTDAQGRPAYLNDTWIWTGWTWQQLNPVTSPPPRQSAAMRYDATLGGLVLNGGWGNTGFLGDTWLFANGTWQQLSTSGPQGRAFPSLGYDAATKSAVLFGGSGTSGMTNDTWTLNP